MRVIRAPQQFEGTGPAVFLAGGITGCPTWQRDLIALLGESRWTILDPRRDPWPDDPQVVEEQITWEHRHLKRADLVVFWFPHETLCPITLYELGAWSMTTKPLVVGVHPEYSRRFDVQVQTRLARPDVPVVASLEAIARALRERRHPVLEMALEQPDRVLVLERPAPVISSKNMTPSTHTSEAGEAISLVINSGDKYAGGPGSRSSRRGLSSGLRSRAFRTPMSNR